MQEQTIAFLDALSNSKGGHNFRTFDDNSQRKAKQLCHNLPGNYLDVHTYLDQINEYGGGLFFTVQETDGRGGKNENITGLRALFVDSDTVRDAPLKVPVPPSARVSSSPGREHIYWFLKPGEDPARLKEAQKVLARYLDTDPGVCDLARVMRLPGSKHCKGEPYVVELTELNPDRRYTIDEVLAGFEGKGANTSQYAEWKLGGMLDRLKSAHEGTRNNSLYSAAFVAKDLVAGGALDETKTRDALTAAALEAGLEPGETDRTIDSAFATSVVSDVAQKLLSVPKHQAPVESQQEADLARHLAGRLGANEGHLKIVDGFVYQYDPRGVWVPLKDKWLKGEIQRYHGAPIVNEKGVMTSLVMTVKKRDNILNMLVHDPDIQADDFWEGATPGVLFRNGFVSPLLNGDLEPRPPSPEFRCRTILDVDFDVRHTAPNWNKFLGELFPNNPDSIKILQEIAGGAMLGLSTQYSKCAVFLGEGSNGKSVLLEALTKNLFDKALSSHIPPGKWGQEYYTAKMEGSLWNVVGELPSWNIVSSDVFKSVITGDEIIGRHPYGQPFNFRPRAAQVFACNSLPSTKDHSEGFWRRFLVLPFESTFDGTERSDEVLARFDNERAGIVAWAMIGAIRLVAQKGYTQTEQTRDTRDQWRRAVDPVASFLGCCCTEGGLVRAMELYSNFRHWCELAGRQCPSSKTFGQRLRSIGMVKTRKSDGIYYETNLKAPTDWDLEID